MALAFRISRQAGCFIKNLPPKQYKQVVASILSLSTNPEPHDSKILKGTKMDYRRIDVGEYRVVYRVEIATLLIAVAAKRNDDEAYKILKRL